MYSEISIEHQNGCFSRCTWKFCQYFLSSHLNASKSNGKILSSHQHESVCVLECCTSLYWCVCVCVIKHKSACLREHTSVQIDKRMYSSAHPLTSLFYSKCVMKVHWHRLVFVAPPSCFLSIRLYIHMYAAQ